MLTYILKLFSAKAVHESRIMKDYDSASIKLLKWNTFLISFNRKCSSSLCEIEVWNRSSYLKDIVCILKKWECFLCSKDCYVFIDK